MFSATFLIYYYPFVHLVIIQSYSHGLFNFLQIIFVLSPACPAAVLAAPEPAPGVPNPSPLVTAATALAASCATVTPTVPMLTSYLAASPH
jgi:hypothetical protein